MEVPNELRAKIQPTPTNSNFQTLDSRRLRNEEASVVAPTNTLNTLHGDFVWTLHQ
jgi:hypothetical protein